MASWRRAPDTVPTQRSGWILAALVLTIGLAGVRAGDLLPASPAPLAGLTPHEARLTGLVETLAGPGHARVHETRTADGTRQVFVLIDAAAPMDGVVDAELSDLFQAAGMLDPLRGDRLMVQRAAFANGSWIQPTTAESVELLAYLLLAACLLGQMVALLRPQVSSQPVEKRPLAAAATPSATLAAQAPVASADPTASRLAAVREAMSEDPAEAARIIRAWVRNELERP